MRKMSSRAFLLICLSLAFTTLIVSDIAMARVLAETSAEALNNEVDSAKGVEESKYPVGGYGGYPGGGPVPSYGPYPGGGAGGSCRYGCCGRGPSGCRCCSYAGEAADAEPQTQP